MLYIVLGVFQYSSYVYFKYYVLQVPSTMKLRLPIRLQSLPQELTYINQDLVPRDRNLFA